MGRSGRLALVDGTVRGVYAPTQLPGTGWTHLVSSGKTTCGVRADATGWCWGDLPGDGSDTANAPVRLPGSWMSSLGAVTGVGPTRLAEQNMCGVQADHTGWCWQSNDQGQIGDGSTLPYGTWAKTPVQVPGKWTSLTTNSDNSCGIRTDDTAACWGLDDYGEVGDGSSGLENFVLSPATLPGAT